MQAAEVIERFRRTGALLEGHFILTSGLHSSVYLQCALVLQHPPEAEACARAIALRFTGRGIETVVAPAIGGIVIGYETARALGARSLWTERDAASGVMTLRRGFTVRPGERVLVVEDVVTTGGSTIAAVERVRDEGLDVIGVVAVLDRLVGGAEAIAAAADAPYVALTTIDDVYPDRPDR